MAAKNMIGVSLLLEVPAEVNVKNHPNSDDKTNADIKERTAIVLTL